MRLRQSGVLLFCVLFCGLLASAQQLNEVPASEAARHLIKAMPPKYPELAKVARITGRVSLEFTVAPDGSVTHLRAVSGHPILLQAALDAVRDWKYAPFLLNGTAVPVQTRAYLLFTTATEAPLQQKYFSQEIECHDLLQAKQFDEAGKPCNAALNNAKRLTPEGLNLGLKMAAYGNAGLAAYHLNNLAEAIEDFQERLKLAKRDLVLDNANWFDVHHDLALALKASAQMEQAENEYRETEKALGTESKSLDRDKNLKEYLKRRDEEIRGQLRQTLTEHAALLRQMGRNSDADDLEQRVKSLDTAN